MIKLSLLALSFFFLISGKSQLNIQSGATFSIEPGARVAVQGDFSNASGTFTNNGTLEVQGNFFNSGTYSSTSNDDSLLLTGAGAVTLNTGAASLYYLQINKTTGGGVTLSANTTVNNKFHFLAGTFSTDPANTYEVIAPFAATFSFAEGTEIIGKVRRNGWVNGTEKMFSSPNMKIVTASGTPPSSILVNMVPNGDPTGTEREVKRTFMFTPTGGADYTADVTFPYKADEISVAPNVNAEANLIPWYFTASEWIANPTSGTVNATSDFVTTTGIPAATFAGNPWKLADPLYTLNVNANLRGNWNGTTMNTSLNTAGLIPLTQPYNITPFNYTGTESVAAIPNANVVDWVLLELRKPSTNLPADATSSTIIGRKAAFLLNNGSIVNLDGVTPSSFNVSKQGSSFIVVRHRNHLAVMSNATPSSPAGSFSNDFTVLANNYKKPEAPSAPSVLLAGGIKYGMWAGDANKSGTVNGTDVSAIKLAIANSAAGYLLTDVNLSASTNGTDASLTKITLSSSGTGSYVARGSANAKATTSVPE
jgi:hypothetical protein